MGETVSIYILPGLVIGCVYAIAASGLVLAYTTSGVVNLAYGAIAFSVALIYHQLHPHTASGVLGAWPAFLLCVLVIGPAIGMVLWQGVFKWLAGLGLIASLIATIGLAIAIPALCLMVFDAEQVSYAPGIAQDGTRLTQLGPIKISIDQIYGVGAAVLVACLLFGFLRFTTLGLKMRAVFDNGEVAGLTGVNASGISNLSWACSGSIAAVGGVVLAPLLGLTPGVFLSLTVASLAAALVGGMRSIALTFVAAIAIGVGGTLLTAFNTSSELLATGAAPSLSFVVMAVTVLVRRRPIAVGQLPRRALEPPEVLERVPQVVMRLIPTVAVLAIVPLVANEYWTNLGTLGAIYGVIFLGYTVALGFGGLLPLGHAAVVGISGFVAGGLAGSGDLPVLLAIAVGVAVGAGIGFVLAAIGGHLGMLEFGLLTLAFGLFADNFLFNWGTLVPPQVGVTFERPSVLGVALDSTDGFYYAVVVVLLATLLGVGIYRRRLGALYVRANRMNPRLAAAVGVRSRTSRMLAFTVASGLGGLGGGMLGLYQQTLQAPDVSTAVGLVWLAVVVFMGVRSPSAAVIAGVTYAVFPALVSNWVPIRWTPVATVLFGLGALALAQDPRGLVDLYGDKLRAGARRLRAWSATARASA